MSNQSFEAFVQEMDRLGGQKIPFIFLIDYEQQKPIIWPISADNQPIFDYNLNGFSSTPTDEVSPIDLESFYFHKNPLSFEDYQAKFNQVVKAIKAGDSFLVNLSQPTPITTNLSLEAIFRQTKARYRFLLKGQFVCFSPEIFVQIHGNRIASFPMKGTIDAAVPNAASRILEDEKEKAEHATIVDLIRNDLSKVAASVWVEKYRYIDTIETNEKRLLQVSSEIAGIIQPNLEGRYGSILKELLPAGSICGAPKPSTLSIINRAEQYTRGYYTGIVGYFDGDQTFDSAVMIRFIEQTQDGQLVFKSGGGITARSQAQDEYQELIDKVYLPLKKYSYPSSSEG